MKNKIIIGLLLLLWVLAAPGYAETSQPPSEGPIDRSFMGIQSSDYDAYRWSALFYYGIVTNNDLIQVMHFHYNGFYPNSNLYSLEVSRQLAPDNLLRRIFNPLVSTIELAANGSYEEDNVYEFNPYILFRWVRLPWNHIVYTTFGFGEGVSIASAIPARELRTPEKAEIARKFLNYLMFEVTFSLPQYPQWQILYRLHHRSGVFGTYSPGITGSTAAGVGIRYRF